MSIQSAQSLPLSPQQWDEIAEAARDHRQDLQEVPVLPALTTRSSSQRSGKRRRAASPESPPSSTSSQASKRRRDIPARRPTTRSQSAQLTDEEKDAIREVAGRGIGGARAISIHQMVNRQFRIPEFVKKIGSHATTFYFDERRSFLTTHNEAIRKAVTEETERLREASRGDGVVTCPDCSDQVAWGNLLPHRLETCLQKKT